MVAMVLTMAGKTTWNLFNVLLAFGLNIGLDLWLIPSMGMLGAAIGWAVAILAANVVPLVQVVTAFGLHPFGRGTLLAMGLALACMGAIPLVVELILGQGAVSLGVSLVLGGATYAALLWRTRRQTALLDLLQAGRRRAPKAAVQG